MGKAQVVWHKFPKVPLDSSARPQRKPGPRKRCACGKCVQCLDEAKWNRIFDEKFKDPEYYTRTDTRRGSPLVTVRDLVGFSRFFRKI